MSDTLTKHKSDNSPEGWECDACGADVSFADPFCRNCGADISEVGDATGEVKTSAAFTPIERNSIAACCGLSLLLFFLPLVTMHVPIVGDQDVSGYDVFSKLSEFREKLKRPAEASLSPDTANEAKVPDIIGKDRFLAEIELTRVGLNLRVRATRPSGQVKPDIIIFQLPRAGEIVKVGQTVAVDVSRSVKKGEVSEAINHDDDSFPLANLNNNKPNESLPGQTLPLSIKLAWLLPLTLMIAFGSAAFALVAALKGIGIARVFCLIGVCFSAVPILHITIMNSDIHSWLAESLKTTRGELKDNPFAGLAENLEALLVNAFQIKPGWGLYALLILLGLAAVLGFSRLLSRSTVVPKPTS